MLLELLVILVVLPQIPGDCPPQCDCKWKSGKESVVCINGNLTRIPGQLDASTQLLDLTGNLLTAITNDAFISVGLLNLQKIYIAKGRIRTLERYAFRKLKNLVELDLSYNIISAVPSHIFDSIPELRELKLNGNPIQRIANDAFISVPQLVKLELTDCKIKVLESRAFAGLEQSLVWLKLDKNRLIDMKSSTMTSLLNLNGLELAGNPWNCSCGLRTLRQWMLSHNIPSTVPPTCRTPQRLAGKTWDKLSVDDFACIPGISPVQPVMNTEEGENVTLSCVVKGNPPPTVKWIWKNRPIANVSTPSRPNHKRIYILHYADSKSSLTIYSVEVIDAGVYFCVASNKAGKVQSNVTLSVSRRKPEVRMSGKVIFAGGVVAFLFLLASCLLLCLLGQPKKETRTLQAESYEKIEMDKKSDSRFSDIPVSNKIHPKNCEYRGVPSGEEGDGDDEGGSPSSHNSEPIRPAPKLCSRDLSAQEMYTDLSCVQQHILHKEVLPTGSLYTTAAMDDRNYPDLVTSPPPVPRSSASIAYSTVTLPRVSSSQSPLLAGSRCGSSAGESSGSNRRFSMESRSSSYYRCNRLAARPCERSLSSLNLCEPELNYTQSRQKSWHHPSLPTSPIRQHRTLPHSSSGSGVTSETPILNLLGSAVYDYHAAQLERFLEEYRSLQEQLNKMKETCEGLRDPIRKPDCEERLKSSAADSGPYSYTSSSIYNDLYRS
ncbi:hypothetical protein O3M35_007680 [Rhynocoris fuscipes]|uniref:Ig-like domain-containing protein n=1 Tax=Rhynocoris fuscipes TaxID=488301 RepID=A0AAW1DCT0_9HEMI